MLRGKLIFDTGELNELRRLLSDMERGAKEVAADKNLLKLFTNQLAVRTNNRKRYSREEIMTALRDLAD